MKNKIRYPHIISDLQRDVTLWTTLMLALLSLGALNVLCIIFFQDYLVSFAMYFKSLEVVPAISRAHDLTMNGGYGIERYNRILAIYGSTLSAGILFGGGGILLFILTCAYRFFTVKAVTLYTKNQDTSHVIRQALKLVVAIVALTSFVLLVEIYQGNYGLRSYHNRVYERNFDLYRYPIIMWISLASMTIGVFALYIVSMIYKWRNKQ